LNSSLIPDLIHLEVKQEDSNPLTLTPLKKTLKEGFLTYSVSLDTPVRPGVKSKLVVTEVYTHRKTPFPKTMKINDVPRI
jgi:hypothetical protein